MKINFIIYLISLFIYLPFAEGSIDIHWQEREKWHERSGGIQEATYVSRDAISECQRNSDAFLIFPRIIQGAHEILIDGKIIYKFGDKNFIKVRSFYGRPILSCKEFSSGAEVEWKAYGFVEEFSNNHDEPYISNKKPLYNFMDETVYFIISSFLFIFSLISPILFMNKIENDRSLYVAVGGFLFSISFAGVVPELYHIELDMRTLHKLTDLAVLMGTACYLMFFIKEKLLSEKFLILYSLIGAYCIYGILTADTGSQIQIKTSLFVMTSALGYLIVLLYLFLRFFKENTWTIRYQIFSLAPFLGAGINDALIVNNSYDGFMLYPLGALSAILFITFHVNEKIKITYSERDFLRANLKNEVKVKTAELEKAFTELQATQAELVQSARLVTLGTLTAGIAHEINNSINFINGSVQLLEKLISPLAKTDEKSFKKATTLISTMREGVRITIDIVKSLRQFTGLNSSKVVDKNVSEIISAVTTILNSKLKNGITIQNRVDEDLTLFCDIVAMNQIFMNLFTNSIDAMPNGGTITIESEINPDKKTVSISIRDTGCGIPEHIKERIFDPFFTTKEEGSGTGLGLYILKKEVDRHHGKIEVISSLEKGTTFVLYFPTNLNEILSVGRAA